MSGPSGSGRSSAPAWPPLDDDQRFEEPWQVELVAVALQLSEAGCFTPSEWAEALGGAIAAAQAAGDPDLGDTYHDHCLAALEALCAAKGLVPPAVLEERTEAWRRAYLRTPHGHPVELSG